jgi:hypothetical protein
MLTYMNNIINDFTSMHNKLLEGKIIKDNDIDAPINIS